MNMSSIFGLSISDLENQNPHIRNGLQAGHTLTINGQQKITTTKLSESYITHSVTKGETLYGLSKKYNASINDIRSANPSMRVLRYGTTISIPVKSNLAESNLKEPEEIEADTVEVIPEEIETFNKETVDVKSESINSEENTITSNQETNEKVIEETTNNEQLANNVVETAYDDYTIKPKETLYGLSKRANMSVAEFLKVNPQLENEVLVGTVIKMPITETENPNVGIIIEDENKSLLSTLDKLNVKKVTFVFPFTEEEFSVIDKTTKELNFESEEYIKRDFEFYKGAKFALDSINKLGVNINATFIKVDSINNTNPPIVDIRNNHLNGIQTIVAPFFGNNIDWLLSLAKDKNIPVISAYNVSTNENLTNIIEALPTLDYQKLKMFDHLKELDGNIVVISDSKRVYERNFIATHLSEAAIIETKKNGNFSSRELSSSLSKTKTNFVIINSERNGVFLNSTNVLLRELSNHKIQLVVLDTSIIPSEDEVSSKRFKILKMLYPELACVSESNKLERFKVNYNMTPSKNFIFGFDITFDSLLRLSQEENTTNQISTLKTSHLCLKFDYLKNKNDRYINDIVLIREFENGAIQNSEN